MLTTGGPTPRRNIWQSFIIPSHNPICPKACQSVSLGCSAVPRRLPPPPPYRAPSLRSRRSAAAVRFHELPPRPSNDLFPAPLPPRARVDSQRKHTRWRPPWDPRRQPPGAGWTSQRILPRRRRVQAWRPQRGRRPQSWRKWETVAHCHKQRLPRKTRSPRRCCRSAACCRCPAESGASWRELSRAGRVPGCPERTRLRNRPTRRRRRHRRRRRRKIHPVLLFF